MSNNAPFAVGQGVVCMKSRKDGLVLKGRTYTVTGVRKVTCGCWVVSVAGVASIHPYSGCSDHGLQATKFINNGAMWAHYTLFAPYDHPAIEIPAELLKEPVEETSDVLTVKEMV